MAEIVVTNHTRNRITFGNPKGPTAVPLLKLGSMDDRGNKDLTQPVARITRDELAELKKLSVFCGMIETGDLSVAGG